MHYDIFNGDADGILSLLQLRLANPIASQLVTGVKRDISLVNKINPAGVDSVTILDVSMEKNIQGLQKLLDAGIPVQYFDHHRTGDIPNHEKLNCHIDTSANMCTALIVNDYLNNRYQLWAIAAAFGDNLVDVAQKRAEELNLEPQLINRLKRLGVCINYNGYGRSLEDLHFTPDELFTRLLRFEQPQELFSDPSSVYHDLIEAYDQDMSNAKDAKVLSDQDNCKVVLLPDQNWSHRVSGAYGNELANSAPHKAHAVLTNNSDGHSYTVSVRAPINNLQGADEVCIQFPTGGGRAGAAGINKLPQNDLGRFIEVLGNFYQ